jgi:hypothetical protein
MVTRARLALVVLLLLLAGCASLAGLNSGKGDDGGVDSGRANQAADGGTDSGAMNVTGDGGDAAPTTYHDFTDPSYWSWFDFGSLDAGLVLEAGDAGVGTGFLGGVFDGRYVYFAPSGLGNVSGTILARYDTTVSFTASASWATFVVSSVNSQATGFGGIAFDGRYVYLVPSTNGVTVRYDTTASFTSASSWTTFDVSTVNPAATGYTGVAYDGRYLYFSPQPFGNGNPPAIRYDTTAPFAETSSWGTFNISSVNANAIGYWGAVFDGRYVTYVPFYNTALDGLAARYDTYGSFGDPTAWSTFDTSTINTSAVGYSGGVFDGRYVYLVPLASPDTLLVAYDTTAPFSSASSWPIYGLPQVNANANSYWGGVFDGRYVYLAPIDDGIVIRHDSASMFTDPASWSAFDTTNVNPNAQQYVTATFDGRYVYFVPNHLTVVARFDSKTPPSVPPGQGASSF